MKVLLFGPAKDAMDGQAFIEVTLPETTDILHVSHLRCAVQDQFKDLTFVLSNSIFAVSNKLVPRNAEQTTVVQGEIVLVPPVSGG